MADKYEALRAAIDVVPCVKWTASRATVHIPETESWAGKNLSIDGLDKQVARRLARYIADANPETIRALLVERDALRAALETIAAYPQARDQEMGVTAMRKIARDALAQHQGEKHG